uniref:Uncharacterized protein n=1 Tax=Coccidioides posadasii RMSCC 3488 TaxID=454284 RepID=A0A0J6FPD4_COCPO|nr:hypothetical protein CPAG_07612 [Coccidioides posadasii RMSCC 3488]
MILEPGLQPATTALLHPTTSGHQISLLNTSRRTASIGRNYIETWIPIRSAIGLELYLEAVITMWSRVDFLWPLLSIRIIRQMITPSVVQECERWVLPCSILPQSSVLLSSPAPETAARPIASDRGGGIGKRCPLEAPVATVSKNLLWMNGYERHHVRSHIVHISVPIIPRSILGQWSLFAHFLWIS